MPGWTEQPGWKPPIHEDLQANMEARWSRMQPGHAIDAFGFARATGAPELMADTFLRNLASNGKAIMEGPWFSRA